MVDIVLDEEYDRCIAIEEEEETPTIDIRHSYYKVSAGTGFDLGERDSWETISIPDTPEARKASYALTIKGDSMEPVYMDGDIVLVKEQQDIGIGQIGIFIIDDKGYIKKKGNGKLISINDEYEDIKMTLDTRCCGKVIGRV